MFQEDASFVKLCMDPNGWEESEFVFVNAAIPKFSVATYADVNQALTRMGISSVFSGETADFSSILHSNEGFWLSECIHEVKIDINEYGCCASSFTSLAISSGLPPEKEVDFILDRPFIVVVTNSNNIPLFLGTVNNPNG